MPTRSPQVTTPEQNAEPRADRVARTIVSRARLEGRSLSDPRVWHLLRLMVDVVVLYLAVAAALVVDGWHYSGGDVALGVSFPLLTLAVLWANRPAYDRLKSTFLDVSLQVIAAVSLSAMLMIAAASILGTSRPLSLVIRFWLYGFIYLGVARGVLLSLRRRVLSSDAFAVPTLIVGAGVVGSHLATRLLTDRSYGLRPIGLLDSNPLPSSDYFARPPIPVLDGFEGLADAVRSTGARHVILAFSSEPDHSLVLMVDECKALGIEVSMVPRMYESFNERTTLDHVGGLPLLTLHAIDPHGWQFAVKHAMDRTFALLGLLLASPLMLAVTVSIKLSSPGPVLFRQRRVGRDGHEFDLLKFRTMRQAPAGSSRTSFVLAKGQAPGGVEGLDRRTRVGRLLRTLSIDELPQLVNVLRGDMSLVGPRPERPEYVSRFALEVVGYENRHRVRSGITGWAQVHGLRGRTSISDRVEWDNYYILNWSLRLDFRILVMTIAEVFRYREGA
jgi:exopolysaccharide biosynthesis polyprenyl glycosylphosphotransferase